MSPAWLISTSHSPLGALESNRNMQGSALFSPADYVCSPPLGKGVRQSLLGQNCCPMLWVAASDASDKNVTNYRLHLPTSQSSWQANREMTTLVAGVTTPARTHSTAQGK